MRKTKKAVSLVSVLTLSSAMVLSGCASTTPNQGSQEVSDSVEEVVVEAPRYIESTYTIDEAMQGPTQYLEPVFYENEDGPTIGVTLLGVIYQDGKYFRDSNNNQELDVFEDWRLDTQTRMEDLISKLTKEQQVGLLENQLACSPVAKAAEDVYDENGEVILSQLMLVTEDAFNMPLDYVDEDEKSLRSNSTGEMLTYESRSGVLRATTDAETGALWVNALNMTSEYGSVVKGQPSIPFTVISNPQNIMGIPNNLGMGAAVIGEVESGNGYALLQRYADVDSQIWDAKGISRMYGPQIDLVTDPRWGRNSTTYTEDPEIMAGIADALVNGYQHGTDGAQDGDVALIMKHFPGDGAAYNGFESHYLIGQWRVYQTEGSLEKYQLVGFQAAIDAGLVGIMPGYSRQAADGTYGSVAQTYRGLEIEPSMIANAYDSVMLEDLLRDTMGFKGFVNTDSGVITNGMQFGADELSVEERIAQVINSGSDVIGNVFGPINWDTYFEAVDSGLLTQESLDRANTSILTTTMEMGQFENPYKNVEESKATATSLEDELTAIGTELNQKSIVLMKNSEEALPLTDTSVKVFIASFTHEGENDETVTKLTEAFETAGFTVVTKASEADVAYLDVVPGNLTTKNAFMNVLDLVDKLKVEEVNYPDDTSKTGEMVEVTTLADVDKIATISEEVHANGGIVIGAVNISSPWILTNLEPYCDGLLGVFDTSVEAKMDVITGAFNPTGKLPVTMVSCEEVLAVEEVEVDGVVYEICVSPNDVPGYDKDQYISEEVLAKSPSGSYAYKDADGNMYTARFGLSY